jgi:hypothetical protein
MFNRAKMFDKWANIFIYLSSALSIALIFISPTNERLVIVLNALNCVVIALVVLFDQLFNYLFFEAGKAKRLDFIDNSFGTDFSGTKSLGYFTNENLSKGIYKMAVNCFENSFFSKNTSGKMISGAWLKAVIILIIFVFNSALGAKGLVNLLFQLSLPILLITQSIKITFFYTRINTTYEGFLSLFSDFKQVESVAGKDAEILKLVLEYQTTLTWGAIPLSNRIFNKYNTVLSRRWDELKANYNIQ